MIQARDAHAAIARSGAVVAAAVAAADPAAPVPTCPGWIVRELVVHLGETHRWATSAIITRRPDPPAPTAPTGDDALPDWYLGTVEELLRVLTTLDPTTPAWTFGEPATAAFWSRRQAHELAVHRWDLGAAIGLDLDIEPDLALDGIDEVATMFFPRQVRLGRTPPLTAALAIAPDGGDRSWVLAGDGTGTAPVHLDATLSGPAEVLLLLLWGRLGLDDPRIDLTGDPAAARRVLTAHLVP